MLATPAYAAHSAKEPLRPFTVERREPGPNDVLIDILYCGVCHSDLHQVRDEWGGAIFPMVPGHEIVGKVAKVGKKVKKWKVGDAVGVGCFVDSCRKCEACKKGEEQYCGPGMSATYNSREQDGKTLTYGGYSTRITVDQHYVLRIPKNLPLDKAAPLLCAGITTYSPLRHWKVKKGQKVGVIGLGGLGHMAVKIASAMGAQVVVLSSSPSKEKDAKRLGAKSLAVTADPETFNKLAGTFDLILNTVSAALDWNQYLNLLKRDGTMVILGAPGTPVSMEAFSFIMKRHRLTGSLIGGIKETQQMLNFCGKHNITADIELIPISEINKAYERILKSDVRYRFVIDIASLK